MAFTNINKQVCFIPAKKLKKKKNKVPISDGNVNLLKRFLDQW